MIDCIFCKIVKGEAPAHIIWESKTHLAFLSIFPNTPGFSVVIPKEHKPSYAFENDDSTLTALVLATKQVAKKLDAAFSDVGRTGMFFEGFGVDHLHAKLFPMHGTADMKQWKPIEREVNAFFDVYPGYLSSHNAARANDDDLHKLAEKIRNSEETI